MTGARDHHLYDGPPEALQRRGNGEKAACSDGQFPACPPMGSSGRWL